MKALTFRPRRAATLYLTVLVDQASIKRALANQSKTIGSPCICG